MSKGRELYDAVRKGSIEAVENLLSEPGMEKEINKMHENGQETLLCVAVKMGSMGIIELLIQHGANVDKATPTKTCLHVACFDGNMRVCKCLVNSGANLEIADETGRTAVQWAAKSGKHDLLKFLVGHKAKLDRKSNHGDSILHDCIEHGSSDMILDILERNVCAVDESNDKGETALFLAAAHGKLDILQKLIALGAKADVTNTNGETLLFAAAKNNNFEIVQYLIEQLALDDEFINKGTNNDTVLVHRKVKLVAKNWTALHIACAFGYADIVRYLLGHGANRNARTFDELRAVEVCKAYKQKQLLPLFEERRATVGPEEKIPTMEQLNKRRQTLPKDHPLWKM